MSSDEENSTSTGTSYDSDTLVIEHTSYSCPICGNDSYGEIHTDCATQCENCSKYYNNDKLKMFESEGHRYDEKYLCKNCYQEAFVDEEELPQKEPEE